MEIRLRWFLAFASGLSLMASGKEVVPETPVALVNGEAVSAAELQSALRQERAATYARFTPAEGKDFWTTGHDGVTPLEFIRDRARTKLVRSKVQQLLMREQGLWPDISHAALQAAMQRENERRRTAVASGHVVYGPVEYSEENYFAYVFGNTLIQSRTKLETDVLRLTEADLHQSYEQWKDRDFNQGPRVNVAQIIVRVPTDASADQRRTAQARMSEARSLLDHGADFEAVAANFLSKDIPLQRSYARPDIAMGKMEKDRFAEAALQLHVGESSPVIEDSNSWAIFKALAREEVAPAPFEEVRDEIRIRRIEIGYADYIDRRIGQAKIELIQPAWDEVRPE